MDKVFILGIDNNAIGGITPYHNNDVFLIRKDM